MLNSVESLKVLIENLGEEWKDRLTAFFRRPEDILPYEKKYIIDFMNSYKEDFIGNRPFNLAGVEKLIGSDVLNNEIENYIDDMLNMYYASEALRELERKDAARVRTAVDFIFERVILRFESGYEKSYEKYEFKTEEEFSESANVLDSLTTFVVSKNLYKATMTEVVYDNTRLTKENCQYIVDKINENFVTLQRKLMVGKLYELLS